MGFSRMYSAILEQAGASLVPILGLATLYSPYSLSLLVPSLSLPGEALKPRMMTLQ